MNPKTVGAPGAATVFSALRWCPPADPVIGLPPPVLLMCQALIHGVCFIRLKNSIYRVYDPIFLRKSNLSRVFSGGLKLALEIFG